MVGRRGAALVSLRSLGAVSLLVGCSTTSALTAVAPTAVELGT